MLHLISQKLKFRFRKNKYRGGGCLKRGAWTVCRFKEGGLGKKEGVGVFKGGGVDFPMHTMTFPLGETLSAICFYTVFNILILLRDKILCAALQCQEETSQPAITSSEKH